MNVDDVVAGVDPDHHLMLVAALCPTGQATEAWQAWRRRVDFDDIDGPTQRLLPLIARRPGVIPQDDPVRRRVRGLYRQSWVRNHRLWHESLPVLDALEERRVPVLLLKGGALLPLYGDDWGARPMYDVDLLVPDERYEDALVLLRDLGWIPEQGQSFDWVRRRMRRTLNGWGFQRGEHGHIDLHQRALAGSLWKGADAAFWAGAVEATIDGTPRLVLHPADLLVHLLLHGVQFVNNPPVQWVADVVHVTRAVDPKALAPRFVEQARSHGALRVAEAGLGAIHRLVDDDSVLPLLAAVTGATSYLERLRHHRGPGATAMAQLARNSTGGAGPVRGARDLVGRRLELDLVNRPWTAGAHVTAGRSPAVDRALRRLAGPYARPPVPPGEPLRLPVDLDLTDPSTTDRFGGPGWEQITPGGAVTMGRESYLVLPLADRAGGSDTRLWLELELASLDAPKAVDVVVNGVAIGPVEVAPEPSIVRRLIEPAAITPTGPLEVVLRARRQGIGTRPPVYLRVLRVRIGRPPGDP